MQLQDLKNEKVGICVSGGLDSRTVARRLLQANVDCLCFTADLAQPDEDDIQGVARKMAPTGAKTHIVDRLAGATEIFAQRGYPLRSMLTIRDFGIEPE